ncbi:hypothetical protein EXIGLDRAFT_730920 [Exidia glandulosa HHB12029]|uniref:HTH APSES-type domain-containing protein n=1 Tax=Exidia glandulosa HHB12029 TaxID=1314781 RepID=A0A165PXT6_EXIGL|nr:hypothetical protein EXIGLDRAFT_730920 [Exidia glandulosa HHB12029]
MVAPKQTASSGRPPLPQKSANPWLVTTAASTQPVVKFQIITREQQDITVGRVKVFTPNGKHAFILRRFDTGAISLTTMFRAAFPDVDEELEKAESAWVKATYEAPGTNNTLSGRLRLAGTWITPKAALDLAPDYHLQHIIPALISATAEAEGSYRRSTKGDSPVAAKTRQEVVSPTAPNKRARQSSPQVASATTATRASTRIKSPARATPPRSARATRATPTRATPGRASRASLAATAHSMVVEEDDDAPDVPGPDPELDIAESKALVQEIMAQHGGRGGQNDNTLKRSAAELRAGENAPVLMNLDGPGLQVGRPIAGNRRLNIELNPEQKALAWGTLAFAFGMGVTSFILPMIA